MQDRGHEDTTAEAVDMATNWPSFPGPHELATAALVAARALRPEDGDTLDDGRILKRLIVRAPAPKARVSHATTADGMLEDVLRPSAGPARNGLVQLHYTETPQAENGFLMWHHQWLADHPDWIGMSAHYSRAAGRDTMIQKGEREGSVRAIVILPAGVRTGRPQVDGKAALSGTAAAAAAVLEHHGAASISVMEED